MFRHLAIMAWAAWLVSCSSSIEADATQNQRKAAQDPATNETSSETTNEDEEEADQQFIGGKIEQLGDSMNLIRSMADKVDDVVDPKIKEALATIAESLKALKALIDAGETPPENIKEQLNNLQDQIEQYQESLLALVQQEEKKEKVAAPTFSIDAGEYAGGQSVTITTTTSNAQIFYTLDGSEPTVDSTLYTGPITVSASAVVKAIATKSGWRKSASTSAEYKINGTVAAPTFSVAEGTYDAAQSVELSSITAGASIRYTTDGSTPTSASTLYSAAISVSSSTTIKAIA